MKKFKYFLMNESKVYLGQKVNDVLTSLQDIQSDIDNLGSRHLSRLAENIVNELRKILHGQWEVQHQKYLVKLQKIAVAIMKTVEDRGDLREILPSATKSLEAIAGELGVKINSLQAPEMPGQDVSQDDFEQTGNDPSQMQQQQPQGQMPQGQGLPA